jgi:putative ABC transport system permease protein
MITVAWRSLISRRLAVLVALVAVMVGSALVTTALLILAAQQAVGGTTSTSSWRFDGADAVVKPSDQVTLSSGETLDLWTMPRLTEEQQESIAAAEGVDSVAFETPFPAYAVNDGSVVGDAFTRSWGHPWSTAEADGASLVDGAAPSTDGEVAIDREVAEEAGVSVGDRIEVQLATGLQTFIVSGTVERGGEQFEKALFFTPAVAKQKGGQPVLALVSFDGAGSAKALGSALPGDLQVVAGAGKATALQLDLWQAELAGSGGQFFRFIAFMSLTIAVFVVSSTLSVSIQQRRKEIAIMRVVGTRPRLVRRMVVWEAMVVGLFGGAAGTIAGIPLAHLIVQFRIDQNLMARATEITVTPTARRSLRWKPCAPPTYSPRPRRCGGRSSDGSCS